jgi:CHAT domain-containing protein/tetratricopeptide (TPR) repeat protein
MELRETLCRRAGWARHPALVEFPSLMRVHRYSGVLIWLLGLKALGGEGGQQIYLRTGETLRAVVDQHSADWIVVARGAAGQRVAEFDSFSYGPEPVCFELRGGGVIRLEALRAQDRHPVGRISIETESHPTTDADRAICQAVGESTLAKSLEEKGGAASLEEAVRHNQRAVELWRKVGDASAESRTLNKLGTVLYQSGRYEEARDAFTRAENLARAAADRRAEGEAISGAGSSSYRRGEIQTAIEQLTQALGIWKSLDDKRAEANANNNLGVFSYAIGEWQAAIGYYLRTLDLVRALGDRKGEASALNNLGVIYDALGQPQLAMRRLEAARRLFQATGDRRSLALTLVVIGRIALALHETRIALHTEREAIETARTEGVRRTEAEAHQRTGEVLEELGEAAEASAEYDLALAQFRALSNREGEAGVLHRIGLQKCRLGDTVSGIPLIEKALEIRSAMGLQDRTYATLSDLAKVEFDRGRSDLAREQIERALEIVETLRSRVPAAALQTSYFATRQESYAFYIDVLMTLDKQDPAGGFSRLAFEAAERSRARSLLDSLAEMQSKIVATTDPQLRELERNLRREVNRRTGELLRSAQGPSGDVEIRHALEIAQARLQDVEMRIRTENPRYAVLTRPRVLPVDEVQRDVLDENTLLLEYSLGKNSSYLWVVGRDSMVCYRLPAKTQIESVARRFLRAASQPRSEDFDRVSGDLGAMVLGPAAGALGRKRLLVLADGLLLSTPFAALRAPGEERPVIFEHEVVTVPSVSALAMLRRPRIQRPGLWPALVVADPVFDPQDPRVSRSARLKSAELPELDLSRLPYSRDEAAAVAGALAPGPVRTAEGFAAVKELLTSPSASQYGLVHIATHSVMDPKDPERTGIVFSRVDSAGRSREGFLRLREIFDLHLEADLVVLSSCRSGDGPVIPGEGIAGLAQAFLYSGAASVVMTQWNIDDEATAELMRRFYALQTGAQRLRPGAALRAAQMAISREPRWRSPYYWGAFILNGDWR